MKTKEVMEWVIVKIIITITLVPLVMGLMLIKLFHKENELADKIGRS